MKEWEEEFIDLEVHTVQKKSCFTRWFALVWLPLLIFLGIVASYMGFIAFKVELHSVIMIGAIFFIYLFFVKQNAHYASCKFNKQHEDMALALKWYIKNNRLTIGDITKANAPFDAFMQDFTTTLRNDNFASVAAGVFPTLGILGTFISIALSMPDFSSQSSAQLEREISLLLGGVGTAFYVSIYGIFLSLWWTFYEKSGMSRFEKQIHKIKENLRHHFWTREEIEQLHFTKSMENYERLNQTFEKVSSNEFLESMQDTLQHRLELFDSVIAHEQQALQKTSTHFNNIINESERSMEQSDKLLAAYEHIALSLQHISSRLDDSNHTMRQMMDRLAQKEEKLRQAEDALSTHIASLNGSLGNLSAHNVKELYNAVVQNIEIMKSESAKVGYAFNKNLEDFDEKYTERLRHSLELIDSETAKIVEQLSQLRVIDNR
jgi:hypothetical protein